MIRQRLSVNFRATATCLFLAVVAAQISGCTDIQKNEIRSVMKARDQAISHKNISAYSRLLLTGYHDRGYDKIQMVLQMMAMFNRFNKLEMHSFDRVIRVLDSSHAQCQQSYRLRVQRHKIWRTIVEREQLQLKKTADGWKISAGL